MTFIRRNLINFAIKYVKKMVPDYELSCSQFKECVDKGKDLEYK
jgi:hypothetical protein